VHEPVLATASSWELPLAEVSALALRPIGPAGATELVAVEDERYAVATAAIARSGVAPGRTAEIDAGQPAGGADSEFEGVASDASGRLFVLQEGAARILVLDAALHSVEQTVALRVSRDQRDFGRDWNDPDDANSRGEGLLLLRGGRVLVAKQREPVCLIEFGPRGEAARGFAPGTALGIDEAFQIGADEEVELEVLASWGVDHSDVESINDLAVNDDGQLHVISSKSRSVARLEVSLEPGGGEAQLTAYALPEDLFQTDDDKAEGLVFTPELGWLVGLDLNRTAPNVFQIAGLPSR
jgi:hypothetical protein